MRTNRVEQHVIRRNHPLWIVIDQMCLNSKNLYNYANYIIRQEFIKNGRYITYYDMNKSLKTSEEYRRCMSQPANCTLRMLDKAWKSYFSAIDDWKQHPDKYLGIPKIPKYLKKDGRYVWAIPNNSCYLNGDGIIHFRIRKLQSYIWRTHIKEGRLIQIRFVPKGSCYVMDVVYEIDVPDPIQNISKRIASIDIGVDNLVTMVNNIGVQPIIINGRGIKSINQYYNKRVSAEKSSLKLRHNQDWSRFLEKITFNRHCRIKNYMHNTSRYIVNWCQQHNIDTLVVGHNQEWKQNVSLGKRNNQNFVMIPYNMLLWQLEYKCQDAGIKFIMTDESYTSGTSFLDNEEPKMENYNKDRRIYRGLFKSNSGRLINSDVNGALQIMKKVFPDAFSKRYGIEGVLTPMVINAAKVA